MSYDTVYTGGKTNPDASYERNRVRLHDESYYWRERLDSPTPSEPVRKHVFWGTQGEDQVQCDYEVQIEIGFFEHGTVPRGQLRSISVDGFGGAGGFYLPQVDDPERPFYELEPEKPEDGKVLIIMQKFNDAAVAGHNMNSWVRQCLSRYGRKNCILRPHPVHGTRHYQMPNDVPVDTNESLERTLRTEGIGMVATFSSSTAIKTIAMGYKTHVEHDYGFRVGDGETREEWARRMSYRVWTRPEMQNGTVLGYLNKYLEIEDDVRSIPW